jgi:branched-chain amino acid transport system permease protein
MVLETFLPLVIETLTFFSIYLICSSSLNLQQGYTGISNLGLFFSISSGAYVIAALPTRLAVWLYGIDMDFVYQNALVVSLLNEKFAKDAFTPTILLVITFFAAMAVGWSLGYAFTYLSLRLTETYLAVFFLCVAEAIKIFGENFIPLAGGPNGILLPNFFIWLGNYSWIVQSIFFIVIPFIIFAVYEKIAGSPFGRILKAIRENELALQCLGRNTVSFKLKVMAFTSAFLAVTGVLVSLRMRSVVAGTFDRVDYSFWPWLMMMLGGAGNNIGCLVGTFLCIIIRRVVYWLKFYLVFLPVDIMWLEYILLGLAFMLVMIYKPEGILPEKVHKLKSLNESDHKKVVEQVRL